MWNANSKKLKPISLLVIQCVILLTENGVKAVSIPRIQKNNQNVNIKFQEFNTKR